MLTNVNFTNATVTGRYFEASRSRPLNCPRGRLQPAISRHQPFVLQDDRLEPFRAEPNGCDVGLLHANWGQSNGWNLSGDGLSNVTATTTNLAGANLAGADLMYANLTGGTLTGSDMRGATGFSGSSSGEITTNAILPNGTIQGLTLNSTNSSLLVRNNSGTGSIPIQVRQGMSMTPSASLVFALDGNPWGSPISFAPGCLHLGRRQLDARPRDRSQFVHRLGQHNPVVQLAGVTPSGQFVLVDNLGYPVDASSSAARAT